MNQSATRRFSFFRVFLLTSLIVIGFRILLLMSGPRSGDWQAPVVGGYEVWRGSTDVIVVVNNDSDEETPKIPKKVVKLDHNDTFIIAKQQGFDVQFDGNQREELIPDQFKYWILNVKTDEIWGPLEIEEFAAKREELGVDPVLELRDVKEYRK